MRRRELKVLWVRSASTLTMLTPIALMLAGCMTAAHRETVAPPDATQFIREVDLSPRFPQQAQSAERTSSAKPPRAAVYYGESSPSALGARPQPGGSDAEGDVDDGPGTTGAVPVRGKPGPGGQGYEMNFENTPVATAAKAILGDILGVGYTIDPRIQGTVTLSSGRAVPKKDILYVLESALRVINVALVRESRGYRLIPVQEALGGGSLDGAQGVQAGYGISVVPLQHVSAQTLTKLLENFAAKPGLVRADPSRNLLVIQGNAVDRRAAIDTVLTFDADWMRGQSVGIYPVSNSAPEPIIAELERIIDAGEGGLGQNVVKLQPIARQNAVLVVARRPDLLKSVSTWISRLDKSGSAGTGVKVYRMQYGDARQVAALLNDMFGGGSGNGIDSGINQLVPGGGGILASSGERPNNGSGQQSRFAMGSRQSSSAMLDATEPRIADASGGALGLRGGDTLGGHNRAVAPSVMGATGAPLLPGVRIAPDVINNALLIYANQENYRIIQRALQQIDRPQLQVAIDATIAEVTLNDSLSYGVQFYLKNNKSSEKSGVGSMILTGAKHAVLDRVLPGFNFLVGTEAEPRLILDALHAVTKVKVLSTPSVVVIDNQFASIQVGDQIPITTRTAQSVDIPTAPVVNNVDYRNTGVILRVAPRVNANGNVLLDIEQEISNVANTSTAETLTPTVSQRKVRSTIAVASGQTVLLGGLISDREERGRRGIPGIEQIPVIGELIGSNSGTRQRTELIIFIRPQIIRHGVDAHRIATELRAKLTGMRSGDPHSGPGPQK